MYALILFICNTFFLNAAEVSDSTIRQNEFASKIIQSNNSNSSVSTVLGAELNFPFSSLSNALSGKVSGLTTFLRSGEPGKDAATLLVRGKGTYNNNNVLVYVDGFPSSFEHLLSAEIETISILKDATALSQFGIEGANGVIWITTNKGVEGPLKINFQSRYMLQQPTKRMSFLNSYDYARLYNEAISNDKGAWSPVYSESELLKYKNGLDPILYPNVNWYDEVVKDNASYYDASLSFKGGNSNVKYAVVLGYQSTEMLYNNEYIAREDMKNIGQFTKYNFRANTDIKINKIFSASANLGGMIGSYVRPAFSATTLWNNIISYPSNIYAIKNPDGNWGGNSVYMDNPVASISAKGNNTSHERFIQANVKLCQDLSFLIKGLTLTEAVSFSDYFNGYYNKTKDYVRSQAVVNEQDEISYISYGQNTDYTVSDGVSDVWERINYYLSADYNVKTSNGQLSARVAFNQNSFVVDGRNAPYFKQGVFGYLKYNMQQKYLAELSVSYSGSENFMQGHRFGFFPTFSAGWIISNENFMNDQNWIDLLKVRASGGVVGNDNIGSRFLYQSYYAGNSANPYILGSSGQASQNTLAESVVGNPLITWEKSHKYNLGIDFFAFGKLNAVLDLFYDKRTDIISQKIASIPAVFGNILPYENVGIVSNRGIEFELGYIGNAGKFEYGLKTIFSYSKNIIEYQEEPVRSEEYLYRTGNPVGQPFGFEYSGFYELEDFDENGNLILRLPTPSNPVQPGDLKYVDQNNDGLINEDDMKAIGFSDLPQITYSLSADLKYKGFDLNLFFQGSANRSVYLNGVNAWAFVNNSNAPEMAKGRWAYYPEQGIDTRAVATYPRLSTENNGNNYMLSTFWLKNGSYLRLKNAELGYNLPTNLDKILSVDNVRFFVGGTNLITFDSIRDYDPEIIRGYPLTRNYYVGINVSF